MRRHWWAIGFLLALTAVGASVARDSQSTSTADVRQETAPPGAGAPHSQGAGVGLDAGDGDLGPAPPSVPPPPTPSEAAVQGDPYEPISGEVYPNAKRLAGRIAEQLTTYGPSDAQGTILDRVGVAAD